jgi:hypothetical protein
MRDKAQGWGSFALNSEKVKVLHRIPKAILALAYFALRQIG